MSTIQPFAGIRYSTSLASDLSRLLAPPYDILGAEDKGALLGRDPRNFVKIDLPHVPPKAAGPAHAYEEAARQLQQWLQDGTMARDAQPALYAYHQAYQHAGRSYVRKMFFARLRLEPFGEGSIFPHERTFGGPKEDRLALTKATRANLSPIFGLYEDVANVVAQRFEARLGPQPAARGTLEGVENRLWAVTDAKTIAEVGELMQPKPTYIADGHHRCGTAMLYRDWLASQQGPLPAEHPANFVLCVFCAMEDPGLLILPTHRVLPKLAVTAAVLREDTQLEVTRLEVKDPTEAVRQLARFGPQAVCLFDSADGGYYAVKPRAADVLDALEPGHTQPWRRLGLAFLHAYLFDRLIAARLNGGQPLEIHYVKADADAVKEARETKGTAFLMQPTTMEELRDVCRAGDLMPQKSTYFYPKLASGLVVNPLTD